ncbi:MAG: aminopeptidase P N-terminal domain-containing protein [Burkholderia sp.]|nr:MAG: Xaa-Pro aminopeptidase [Burkholderia gladioli]
MNAATETALAPDIYRQRRTRVLAALREAGGGVAIVPTAQEVMRNRDAGYPFRHDSYFYYLSGFAEPDALLVLDASNAEGESQSILFCRAKHPEREIWEGFRYGPEAARTAFGFDATFPNDALDTALPRLLANAGAIYYRFGASPEFERKLADWLKAVRAKARSGVVALASAHDLGPLLDEMRLVKDAHEQAIMRRAASISASAHRRAMATTRPGIREYELEAELLHEFRRHGSTGPAYGSIVAVGANACVLHYPTGNAVARDGDLILIDAACELEGYASDITRTFPTNGKFSGPPRALYDIVLAAQATAVAATRPGVPFEAPHEAALRVVAQGLLDTGIVSKSCCANVDDMLAERAYERFYMHRTSHWLGMDVHDCGDYRQRDAERDAQGMLPWRLLREGMALTIEPGLYVRAAADVPAEFHDIGIRIEDDAFVTVDGCELITREVPVAIDEIEALMRDACGNAGRLVR